MASPTQWTWVWVSSGSWWWTGRPVVLQSMGLQRVGHIWTTELKAVVTFLFFPRYLSCHNTNYPSLPTDGEYYSVISDFLICLGQFVGSCLCFLKFTVKHCTNTTVSQLLQHYNKSWNVIKQVFLPCFLLLSYWFLSFCSSPMNYGLVYQVPWKQKQQILPGIPGNSILEELITIN